MNGRKSARIGKVNELDNELLNEHGPVEATRSGSANVENRFGLVAVCWFSRSANRRADAVSASVVFVDCVSAASRRRVNDLII